MHAEDGGGVVHDSGQSGQGPPLSWGAAADRASSFNQPVAPPLVPLRAPPPADHGIEERRRHHVDVMLLMRCG